MCCHLLLVFIPTSSPLVKPCFFENEYYLVAPPDPKQKALFGLGNVARIANYLFQRRNEMNWKIVDSAMTCWRTKIKGRQTDLGIGSSEDYSSEGDFHCKHFEDCHKSISEGHIRKGDWTYVGRQYGEASVNGKMAKVLFVAMDRTGKADEENFEDTQAEFRNSALKRINPHMGGVDVELVHLLDKETSCEDRCQQFALTNSVRCNPYSEKANSRVTRTMQQNCEHHTEAIIQALEPDIIIVQGKKPRQSMCRLFNLDSVESYDNRGTGWPYRSVKIGQREEFLFLLTAHPANYPGFGWKAGYLPDELKKAFERAREIYAGTD